MLLDNTLANTTITQTSTGRPAPITLIVNPAQIKFFARSTLRRGKTDATDADLIAYFGLMMRPAAWPPLQQALVEIKQLVREHEAVMAEQVRVRLSRPQVWPGV